MDEMRLGFELEATKVVVGYGRIRVGMVKCS